MHRSSPDRAGVDVTQGTGHTRHFMNKPTTTIIIA
jgi:hypothetical protein